MTLKKGDETNVRQSILQLEVGETVSFAIDRAEYIQSMIWKLKTYQGIECTSETKADKQQIIVKRTK